MLVYQRVVDSIDSIISWDNSPGPAWICRCTPSGSGASAGGTGRTGAAGRAAWATEVVHVDLW